MVYRLLNENLFFNIFFLVVSVTFSQKTVTGIVIDASSKSPLPFANIILDNHKGTITNADGSFEFESNASLTTLTVSYIGYEPTTVLLNSDQNYYKIELKQDIQNLGEVVLVGSENPALSIIRNAIERRTQNDPEKKLRSYKFKTYNKLLVTANPDSINGAIDSIYTKKNGVLQFSKVDSSNYELKKQLTRSHLYMTEKISEYTFNKEKGNRETILATRMAGFKEPIYEALSLQLQSFSFYKNKYTLFGTDYINPIANNAIKIYNYRILDTISRNNRKAYMIYYFPREKGKTAGLQGVLYIDTETFALHKAIAQLKAIIDIKASQDFNYHVHENVWFPVQKEIRIRRGDNKEKVNLFNNSVGIQFSEPKEDSTSIRTNNTDPSKIIHLISTEKNFNIELNQPVEIKGRGLYIDVDEKASSRDLNYWNSYRTDSITKRDLETYTYMDSIIETEGVEKKIYIGRKLLKGYLPSKYVDFDLRNLLKYNNYEGFRMGMGIVTNTNFSARLRLNAYGVYGTLDKEFKYGFGAATRLNKYTSTWIGANYINDLTETGSSTFITDGRAFSLFEPRLFNITSFYKTKTISSYLSHDITPKTSSKLQLNYSEIEPAFNYTYSNEGFNFNTYKITTLTTSFQWNPLNEYMFTKDGKKNIKTGYPQIAFQATQSFENLLESDFNFTKLDFRGYYELRPLNKGKSTFLVKAGYSFGDVPITHLYNLSPNQPTKTSIMKRFSIAGRDSFETMFFNEFFSDRYATIQAKHFFKRFNLTSKISPEIVLISRFAIGDVSDKQKHLEVDFKSLEHGFFESGLELNKIISGFGLSAMYRYGAYRLPGFDNNLSFKFTYYFTLGF